MKDILKGIALLILIVTFIVGGTMWKFHLWKLEHPTAPTWVFWAKGGR